MSLNPTLDGAPARRGRQKPNLALRKRALRTGLSLSTLAAVALTAVGLVPAGASNNDLNAFNQRNLVSDIAGVARVTDANLVNPWGLAASPTSPLWVADNNANVATVYGGAAHRGGPIAINPLVVNIPDGAPTGAVFNPTKGFVVSSGSAHGPAAFIFATENGEISGWNPAVPPPAPSTHAQLEVPTTNNGVYKGLAIATNSTGTFLFAANFRNGTVDVFDSNFKPATLSGSFADPSIPAGFAPFGIQTIGDRIYVTYAMQNAQKHDDVAGPRNGFVNVFDAEGHLIKRLASHGTLNSPWGLALAPEGFGPAGGDLLVGNFGDGHINVFDPKNGAFLGQLSHKEGDPIVINGLWGLRFGNGVTASPNTLIFSAGIGDESHGLLGTISANED